MVKTENEIYYFLKNKLKEPNIKVNDFYNMCGVSKATMYRVMKGYQKPTPLQREKIIGLLKFDEFERDSFFECIRILEFDEREIEAFTVIDSIFAHESPKSKSEPMEFIVYEERKSVMTYDGILDIVRETAVQDGFYCDIMIYDCCRDGMLVPFERLLSELNGRMTTEHFVN